MKTYRKSQNSMSFGMRATTLVALIFLVILGFGTLSLASCDIFLDADTPATGGLLNTQPLVTPFGIITFDGDIRDRDNDPEFNTAGALGNVFDIYNSPIQTAQLFFDFDILSATFIYGGNMGSILVEARDTSGALLDSFFQADTYDGQPAGPVTLASSGIRSLYWEDTVADKNFASLDNICILVPEPTTILLLTLGGLVLKKSRR